MTVFDMFLLTQLFVLFQVDIPRTYARRASAAFQNPTAVAPAPVAAAAAAAAAATFNAGMRTPKSTKRRLSSTSTVKFVPMSPLEPSLRRVLRAFATSHRAVGYCQAMNFIAARFLLLSDDGDPPGETYI